MHVVFVFTTSNLSSSNFYLISLVFSHVCCPIGVNVLLIAKNRPSEVCNWKGMMRRREDCKRI